MERGAMTASQTDTRGAHQRGASVWTRMGATMAGLSLGVALLCAGLAHAQAHDRQRGAAEAERKTASGERDEVEVVELVRRAVLQRLRPSGDEREKINRLFGEHRKTVERLVREDEPNRQLREQLRGKLRQARMQTDKEQIQRLRRALRDAMGTKQAIKAAWIEFDRRIMKELSRAQLRMYRQVAYEIRRPKSQVREAMQQMSRMHDILRDMDLDEQQRQELRSLISEASARIGDMRGDPQARLRAMQAHRKRVMTLLNAQQRETLLDREERNRRGASKRDTSHRRQSAPRGRDSR